MAGAQIGLILLFLLLFIMTRTVWVRIIKDKSIRLELHLPLLAVILKNFDNGKNKTKLNPRSYISIASNTIKRVRESRVFINAITFPCDISNFNLSTLVGLYGYHGFIYTLIAYLKAKGIDIYLKDNAITSSPDIDGLHCHVTLKLTLLRLVYALLYLSRDIRKERKAKEMRSVGE